MAARSYEQTWFWLICGHGAPKEPKETTRARKRQRLLYILAQKEGGLSAAAIAQEQGWSKDYTWQQLRLARSYRDRFGEARNA